ncbi:unnamed protein product [Effrenium voratum]|nr:unnamed protein product [Effrenium voratum]
MKSGMRWAVLLAAGAAVAYAQPRKQSIEAPKWLDDDGKELFNEIENDDKTFGDLACEYREKLLKAMAGKGDPSASSYRARTLLGLGLCEVRRENWAMAKKRLESAISEMNAPSEDAMLKNPDLAPLALTKQASDLMKRFEITQASTQLRRCREVLERNLKTVLKRVQQQMSQSTGQSVPLDKLIEEIPGYGKTGQFLPTLLPQVPGLKEIFSFAEVTDITLESLDNQIAAMDGSQKKKRLRLDVSKGKGKAGTMLYARGVFTPALIPAEQLAVAKELVDAKVVKAMQEIPAEKAMTLLKRTKLASGCKDAAGLCEKLEKVPDLQSNGFGETRLVVVKEGKKQTLDTCTTNANIGVLLATKEGVRLTVGPQTVELEAGQPLGFDFCQEASLELSGTPKATVLFAQAWHPELAAVERTTELRARGSSAFGLSEEEVKAATKVVNDHAKSTWEKTAKQWRSGKGLETLRQQLQQKEEDKLKAKEVADEAKRKEEEAGDEARKKNLEELERKRAEKRKQQEAAEAKRLARKKQLEEERAKRDPWLLFPEVVEAERRLEDLKEQRRDANTKLEFDLSTSLTKEISAAERALKSVTKKAKKAFKKGAKDLGGAGAQDKEQKEEKEEKEEKENEKLRELKSQLEAVKAKKEKASAAENFKEAKKLKAEQKDLEDRIKREL